MSVSDGASPISVQLVADETLVPPEARAEMAAAVRDGFESVRECLAIPGAVNASVTFGPCDSAQPQDRLQVIVDGTPCRYPQEIFSRVLAVPHSRILVGPEEGDVWLSELGAGLASDAMSILVATICREIAASRPSVLLHTPQAAAYVTGTEAAGLDAEWVRAVLAPVVDARIALTDNARVAMLLNAYEGHLPADAAEVIIA